MNIFIDRWRVFKNQDNKLKNLNGNIITRFMPKTTGYLQIEDCKSLLINYVMSRKYGGMFTVIFNNIMDPSLTFKNNINDDMRYLDIIPDKVVHVSDYFDMLINFADKLVSTNKAYVKYINNEKIYDSYINLWNKMKSNIITDCVLNIKINNLDDLTIYVSVNNILTPTIEFIRPIIDCIENITHVYECNKYNDIDKQRIHNDYYRHVIRLYDRTKNIHLNNHGKLFFQKTITSHRKINDLIDNKIIQGWDDPRLVTLQGMYRRGLSLQALIKFISDQGLSKQNYHISIDELWKVNRSTLNKHNEYMVIPENNKDVYKVYDVDNILIEEIYLWKSEIRPINNYDKVTLLEWGDGIICLTDKTIKLSGENKKKKRLLIWIKVSEYVKLNILTYKNNIIGREPKKQSYIGDYGINKLNIGDYVKLYRFSYMKVDKVGNDITFIKI